MLTDKQQKVHNRLQKDFIYFAHNAPLKIKDKEGNIKRLQLNKAQMYAHNFMERMKSETGMVRVLILKGRQQGMSTYIGARFYHHTISNTGTSTFILSHDGETTKKLFRMTKRYHEGVHSTIAPATKASNAKELIFEDIESDYTLGTAGNADVGRGSTIQRFHGSEVGFWDNTDDIQTGVLQAVPRSEGTEIVLESTAPPGDRQRPQLPPLKEADPLAVR